MQMLCVHVFSFIVYLSVQIYIVGNVVLKCALYVIESAKTCPGAQFSDIFFFSLSKEFVLIKILVFQTMLGLL